MACAVLAFANAHAQTDVTDKYLPNPGFETAPVFDGTSTGASGTNATAAEGSTLVNTNPNVYNINGWTTMTTETSDFARTFTMPYATTIYVNGNGNAGGQAVTAPANGSSVQTGNKTVFFAEANWSPNAVLGVKQDVTLPAGVYKLKFDTYVSTSLANASSLCGVKFGTEAKYKWPTALNTWTNNEIVFALETEQQVQISLGYTKTNNVGGGSSAFMFADNVKLYRLLDVQTSDQTSNIVNPDADTDLTGWTYTGKRNALAGPDNNPGIFEPSDWEATAWDGYDKQTIKDLPNGLYKLQAITQNAVGVRAWLTANDDSSTDLPAIGDTGGTVASPDYSVVEAGKGFKGWNYGSVTTLVTDGTLNIAFNAKATAQHLWANVDHFTLTYYEGTEVIASQMALTEAIAKARQIVNSGQYAHTTSLEEAIAEAGKYTESTNSEEITAAVASLDKAILNTQVSNATIENPYAMAIKNGDMATADGWTSEGGTFNHVTNNENPGANVTRPYRETWVGAPGTQTTARKFYQTVACPRGAYELKAAVTATYQVYATNISESNGVYLYIKDGDKITRTPCKTGNNAQYFSVIVNHESDGDLEIGIENEAQTRVNWIAFDNFSLTCYGEGNYDALAKKNYGTALADAKLLDNAAVTGLEKTNVETAMAATPATAEEYVSATSDLKIATINYKENEVVYNTLQSIKELATGKDFPYASAEKKGAIDGLVAQSAAEANTMAAQATAAVRALYESNALAEGVEGAENRTANVPNADFTNYNEGWTSSQTGGNLGTLIGETWTNADGSNGGYYYDYYNGSANNQHATRTLNGLTPGRYIVSLKIRALQGFNIVFTANGEQTDVDEAGNTGNVFNRGWNDYTIECMVDQTGRLDIEVANVVSGNMAGWFGFGNLRLVRLGDFDAMTIDEAEAYAPESATYADVTLKRTLTAGWNAIVLPFDMTVAEAKTVFNASEVKAFSGITTTEAGATLHFADADAIEAGKPVMIRLMSAPATDTYAIGNVLLPAKALAPVEQTSADGVTYAFTGIYEPQTVKGPFAYINGASIYNYKEGDSATSKAFRAYFMALSNSANARVIGISGTATGISDTTVKEQDAEDAGEMHDVLGRRVLTPAKGGMYIINGKTFIEK